MNTARMIENFPVANNNGIPLKTFLNAARGLVALVDDLGKLFTPLSYDMNNNINKIENGCSVYHLDEGQLEDLLIKENASGAAVVADAVLWLKRALEFFAVFYQGLIMDVSKSESLQVVMEVAYKKALQPYHGFVTRTLFSFFKKACPSRTVVLSLLQSRMDPSDVVLHRLQDFCGTLFAVVNHITHFYETHGFDVSSRAP